jgi:hypothetical protein
MIFDYIEQMLDAGHLLPPPADLAEHVYARYLPPPDGGDTGFQVMVEEDDGAGLERLDPVCFSDVVGGYAAGLFWLALCLSVRGFVYTPMRFEHAEEIPN